MKTKAVRLYGKRDLRLEEFELPSLQEDEILAKVVTDSLCMSSYKLAQQGDDHKRVTDNLQKKPIIIGHELCGEIVEVGKKWEKDFFVGDKFAIQPALNYNNSLDAPGYSFRYIGGDATYVIIPNVVMEQNCLFKFEGDSFFLGSLSEPVCCVIGGCNAMYHVPHGTYKHVMGIKEGGNMLIMGGTGPMGLAMVDYCLHGPKQPKLLVITGITEARLKKAAKIYNIDKAKQHGVDLIFLNTTDMQEACAHLSSIAPNKFNDIMVMIADSALVTLADSLLAQDGCMNFFAGPSDTSFSASVNFFNIHYGFTHIVSNSGGNYEDLQTALYLLEKKILNPAPLVSYIGGLNVVAHTTNNLPSVPGGKKLIYTHKNIPLVALEDFKKKGEEESDMFFKDLAGIMEHNNHVWCKEAEDYVLEHAPEITL